MGKDLACAMTHVRHESFFLEKWVAHYGSIVGRENLHVVIDGDDWEPEVDLTGVQTEILLDAPRRRKKNDQFMAEEMSSRANALRKRYHHVIRGDCDEYVVIDPDTRLDWPQALEELGPEGYIFALGIDVVQSRAETLPLDRAAPMLGQRRHGYISDRYTKPFVISRWNNWAGGAHRLLNRPVRISSRFVLFHLALADQEVAAERLAARGGTAQHSSFVGHQTERLAAIATDISETLDYDEARSIAKAQFPLEPDGSPAKRPRKSTDPRADEKGLPVDIPVRFFGLI